MVPVFGPNEIAQLIIHFNHMAITLSERAQLLQQQEERHRTYIGASSHILWTTAANGEVVGEIPTWQTFTGQTPEQVRGNGWLGAIYPDDRPAAEMEWQRCVTERTLFETEFRLRSAAGEYRDFACRGVPIVAADGTPREWIGTCTDITERKREGALAGPRKPPKAPTGPRANS